MHPVAKSDPMKQLRHFVAVVDFTPVLHSQRKGDILVSREMSEQAKVLETTPIRRLIDVIASLSRLDESCPNREIKPRVGRSDNRKQTHQRGLAGRTASQNWKEPGSMAKVKS